jgi:hypothetical protein
MIRVTCYNCEDGLTGDIDCGEDCCACLNPEPDVICDVCGGIGYWFVESTPENFKKLAEAAEELQYEEVMPTFAPSASEES